MPDFPIRPENIMAEDQDSWTLRSPSGPLRVAKSPMGTPPWYQGLNNPPAADQDILQTPVAGAITAQPLGQTFAQRPPAAPPEASPGQSAATLPGAVSAAPAGPPGGLPMPPPAQVAVARGAVPGYLKTARAGVAGGAERQLGGISKEAEAGARRAEEEASYLQTLGQKMDEQQRDADEKQQAQTAEIQKYQGMIQQDIEKSKSTVDPERYFGTGSSRVFNKIVAGIGMALGAAGAALSRGPNTAAEIISRAIDRDI